MRGNVDGYWYCIFCGVSPVGTYSCRSVLAIFDRNSASGWRSVESSGDKASCNVAVLVDISSPRFLTLSYVDVKWLPILLYESLTVDERPVSDCV